MVLHEVASAVTLITQLAIWYQGQRQAVREYQDIMNLFNDYKLTITSQVELYQSLVQRCNGKGSKALEEAGRDLENLCVHVNMTLSKINSQNTLARLVKAKRDSDKLQNLLQDGKMRFNTSIGLANIEISLLNADRVINHLDEIDTNRSGASKLETEKSRATADMHTKMLQQILEMMKPMNENIHTLQSQEHLTRAAAANQKMAMDMENPNQDVFPEHYDSEIAEQLFQRYEWHGAMGALEQLNLKTPSEPHILLRMGQVAYFSGDYKEALKHLSACVAAANNIEHKANAARFSVLCLVELTERSDWFSTCMSAANLSLGLSSIASESGPDAIDYMVRCYLLTVKKNKRLMDITQAATDGKLANEKKDSAKDQFLVLYLEAKIAVHFKDQDASDKVTQALSLVPFYAAQQLSDMLGSNQGLGFDSKQTPVKPAESRSNTWPQANDRSTYDQVPTAAASFHPMSNAEVQYAPHPTRVPPGRTSRDSYAGPNMNQPFDAYSNHWSASTGHQPDLRQFDPPQMMPGSSVGFDYPQNPPPPMYSQPGGGYDSQNQWCTNASNQFAPGYSSHPNLGRRHTGMGHARFQEQFGDPVFGVRPPENMNPMGLPPTRPGRVPVPQQPQRFQFQRSYGPS